VWWSRTLHERMSQAHGEDESTLLVECGICLAGCHVSPTAAPVVTLRGCGHIFHAACFTEFVGRSANATKCPSCRQEFGSTLRVNTRQKHVCGDDDDAGLTPSRAGHAAVAALTSPSALRAQAQLRIDFLALECRNMRRAGTSAELTAQLDALRSDLAALRLLRQVNLALTEPAAVLSVDRSVLELMADEASEALNKVCTESLAMGERVARLRSERLALESRALLLRREAAERGVVAVGWSTPRDAKRRARLLRQEATQELRQARQQRLHERTARLALAGIADRRRKREEEPAPAANGQPAVPKAAKGAGSARPDADEAAVAAAARRHMTEWLAQEAARGDRTPLRGLTPAT
jgi:hypothetical protein